MKASNLFSNVNLRVTVAIALVLGVAFPAMLGGVISTRKQSIALNQELEKSSASLLEILEVGSQGALWNFDRTSEQFLVNAAFLDRRVVKVRVLSPDGTVFAESAPDDSRAIGRIISSSKKIILEEREIGTVELSYSGGSMEADLQSKEHFYIGTVVVQILASFGIILLLVTSKILRPVSRLLDQSALLSQKKLDTPFIWVGSDEMNQIGSSLERTRVALVRQFAEAEQNAIIKSEMKAALAAQDLAAKSAIEKTERDAEVQAILIQNSNLSSLTEMATSIAHEINNPLAILQGKAHLILRHARDGKSTPEKLIEHAESIVNTATRISKIITSVRSIARNATDDSFESIELSHVLNLALGLHAEKMAACNISINLSTPPDLLLICRAVQIQQAIAALLSNSYDAISTLTEKWIRIEANLLDERLILSITDSGKGIDDKVSAKIMLPFFTTKEVGKGTGLGLSSAKGIIETHGGKLWLDQKCPNTRFVLELPLKQKMDLGTVA